MNPTDEEIWVAEGTVLGWVEEAHETVSMVEALEQQRSNPEWTEDEAEQTIAAVHEAGRAEAIAHQPAFNLPEHHSMHGLTGDQMVEKILAHERAALEAWCIQHKEKLRFGKSLNEQETLEISALLYALRDVFAENPKAPPMIDGVEFALHFKDDNPRPMCRKLPRLSIREKEHMSKDALQMLINEIIEFSDSDWATVPVFAKKSDGSLRFAIDYRHLNGCCVADNQGLPNITETLESLAKAKRLSTFDGASGFWAVNMRKDQRKYAAFHAWIQGAWHLVQPCRMMFGFMNATATYVRLMNKLYGPSERGPGGVSDDNLLGDIAEVFVDDTVTKSKETKDHINDLAKVLTRLVANHVTIKMEKGLWGTDELPLLGHVVKCQQGVACDPKKVSALAGLTPMDTVAELRTFLGAAGFIQRYVPEYAELAAALRGLDTLQKVGSKNRASYEKVEWNPEALAAFDALKAALISAPVLAFPDFSRPFIILVDASKTQVGGCLAQLDDKGVERPIAYFSTCLTTAQRNYGITDKEGLGVILATRKFRSYIAHSGCVVITDHSALTSLRNPRKEFKNDRLWRYAVELDQYNIVIAHRAGKDLFMADMLSRAHIELDEDAIKKFVELSWSNTAGVAKARPDLIDRLYELGAAQLRLQLQVRGARIIKGEEHSVSVHQALEEMQAAGCQQPAGTADQESLLTFDMHEMLSAPESQMPAPRAVSAPTIGPTSVRSSVDDHAASTDNKAECDSDYSSGEDSEGEEVSPLYEASDGAVTKAEIRQAQEEDGFCRSVVAYLADGSLPIGSKQARRVVTLAHAYGVRDGMLVRVARSKHALWSAQLQWYVPVGTDGKLRQRVVQWLHRELGHAGILRTLMHIGELFYWPSVLADTYAEVTVCAQCQFFAPRDSKAPVEGHVTAEYPGHKLALDIMHLTPRLAQEMKGKALASHKKALAKLQKQGKAAPGTEQYTLTAVDVYSRKGFVVPLDDIQASTVARAIRRHITVRGLPEEFIFDGGPEFKAEVRAGAKAYDAAVHQATPNHSASMGLIERFNRTIQRKIAKMAAATSVEWQEVYPEAVLAYDASVHEQLSHGSEPLTPGELWYGAKIRLPSLANLGSPSSEESVPTTYMKHLRTRLQIAHEAVEASKADYFSAMKLLSSKRHRPLRVFRTGDKVTRYRPTDSLKVNKLSPLQDGPFLITAAHPSGTSYWIKRQNSDEQRVLVHVDELNEFRTERLTRLQAKLLKEGKTAASPPSDEGSDGEEEEPPAKKGKKQKAVVQSVMAEREGADGRTQYLLRWAGLDPKGKSWECSWEPSENLDCDERISEWLMVSSEEAARRAATAEAMGIVDHLEAAEEAVVAAVEWVGDVRPLKMDLSTDWDQEGSIVQHICDLVGLSIDQIVLLWASPPCETYSQLQYGMAERGDAHRDTKDPNRPPRTLESCEKPAHFAKRKLAASHDRMNGNLARSLAADKKRGLDFTFGWENPAGGMMSNQEFMNTTDWTELTDRQIVDYCNYWTSLSHKPTALWLSHCGWVPGGKSGTGRCAQACHCGRWILDSERVNGMKFQHDFQLGGPKSRAPPAESLQTRWHVPEELFFEVLSAAAKHKQPVEGEKKLWVIELFAGQAGSGSVARDLGYGYVPVDICTDHFPADFPPPLDVSSLRGG